MSKKRAELEADIEAYFSKSLVNAIELRKYCKPNSLGTAYSKFLALYKAPQQLQIALVEEVRNPKFFVKCFAAITKLMILTWQKTPDTKAIIQGLIDFQDLSLNDISEHYRTLPMMLISLVNHPYIKKNKKIAEEIAGFLLYIINGSFNQRTKFSFAKSAFALRESFPDNPPLLNYRLHFCISEFLDPSMHAAEIVASRVAALAAHKDLKAPIDEIGRAHHELIRLELLVKSFPEMHAAQLPGAEQLLAEIDTAIQCCDAFQLNGSWRLRFAHVLSHFALSETKLLDKPEAGLARYQQAALHFTKTTVPRIKTVEYFQPGVSAYLENEASLGFLAFDLANAVLGGKILHRSYALRIKWLKFLIAHEAFQKPGSFESMLIDMVKISHLLYGHVRADQKDYYKNQLTKFCHIYSDKFADFMAIKHIIPIAWAHQVKIPPIDLMLRNNALSHAIELLLDSDTQVAVEVGQGKQREADTSSVMQATLALVTLEQASSGPTAPLAEKQPKIHKVYELAIQIQLHKAVHPEEYIRVATKLLAVAKQGYPKLLPTADAIMMKAIEQYQQHMGVLPDKTFILFAILKQRLQVESNADNAGLLFTQYFCRIDNCLDYLAKHSASQQRLLANVADLVLRCINMFAEKPSKYIDIHDLYSYFLLKFIRIDKNLLRHPTILAVMREDNALCIYPDLTDMDFDAMSEETARVEAMPDSVFKFASLGMLAIFMGKQFSDEKPSLFQVHQSVHYSRQAYAALKKVLQYSIGDMKSRQHLWHNRLQLAVGLLRPSMVYAEFVAYSKAFPSITVALYKNTCDACFHLYKYFSKLGDAEAIENIFRWVIKMDPGLPGAGLRLWCTRIANAAHIPSLHAELPRMLSTLVGLKTKLTDKSIVMTLAHIIEDLLNTPNPQWDWQAIYEALEPIKKRYHNHKAPAVRTMMWYCMTSCKFKLGQASFVERRTKNLITIKPKLHTVFSTPYDRHARAMCLGMLASAIPNNAGYKQAACEALGAVIAEYCEELPAHVAQLRLVVLAYARIEQIPKRLKTKLRKAVIPDCADKFFILRFIETRHSMHQVQAQAQASTILVPDNPVYSFADVNVSHAKVVTIPSALKPIRQIPMQFNARFFRQACHNPIEAAHEILEFSSQEVILAQLIHHVLYRLNAKCPKPMMSLDFLTNNLVDPPLALALGIDTACLSTTKIFLHAGIVLVLQLQSQAYNKHQFEHLEPAFLLAQALEKHADNFPIAKRTLQYLQEQNLAIVTAARSIPEGKEAEGQANIDKLVASNAADYAQWQASF